MNKIKNISFVLAITGSLMLSNLGAFAQQVGVVDVKKVVNSYDKAQTALSNLKANEAELQSLLKEAKDNIKSAKTETEKKSLESKYNSELQEKKNKYAQEYADEWKVVQSSVIDAVKTSAQKKRVQVVIKKDGTLFGGDDLTSDVISILNPKK
ncbi:MAG: OmpH family outer membrane protein [bacterium]